MAQTVIQVKTASLFFFNIVLQLKFLRLVQGGKHLTSEEQNFYTAFASHEEYLQSKKKALKIHTETISFFCQYNILLYH